MSMATIVVLSSFQMPHLEHRNCKTSKNLSVTINKRQVYSIPVKQMELLLEKILKTSDMKYNVKKYCS